MASYDGIGNRIADKYQRKIGKTLVSRHDLAFTDHEIVDKASGTARLLIAFSPLRGEPTAEEVEKFIWAEFEQQVMPKMDTARIYDRDHVIEVLVERMTATMPITEAKNRKMAVLIPGKTYVDSQKAIWEVRAAEDGTKYLVRKSDDNLDEILEERRRYTNASRSARFAKLHTAGYATAQVGDTVEFYSGTKLLQGKILSLGKDNSAQISAGGTSFKVSRHAITRVVQHAESYLAERKRMQLDFYQKFLGPELADKIVNLGPDIEGP